ncbi:MAG TPA: hypothetical protein H9698_10305 [Candidatus Ruthenibacterium merdavium]|uniref:Uncharacterized protein n=1 Tax=Candidatus Ruthenibacterium merdavium TaxID=2838752 RepID=A0A9D2TK14_9FIRM|nr:hypothetical protein [Candidatus Ruthenibacterium merdavium]
MDIKVRFRKALRPKYGQSAFLTYGQEVFAKSEIIKFSETSGMCYLKMTRIGSELLLLGFADVRFL